MKKIASLFILIAIAGLVSINAYAHTFDHHGFGGFGPFGYGYGFGGFGHGMDFTVRTAAFIPDPTVVPIPPTASANSITYDENGEIHVRPFDDEDLFAED